MFVTYPEKLEFEPQLNWFGENHLKPEQLTHCYIHEGYRLKMHSHGFYEINIIVNGRGRHYISELNRPAEVGDVFVIPPGLPHGYFTEQRLDIAHIILKNGFMSRYSRELSEIPGYDIAFDIEPLLRSNSDRIKNLNTGLVGLDRIVTEIHRIMKIEGNELYMYENARVLSLVGEICEMLIKNTEGGFFSGDMSGEVFGIMQYIKQNCVSELRVSQIAEYGNMSAATLNRRFRLLLNMTPMEYVAECRIKKAEELIAQGNMTRAEIANCCGFYDSSHMNKYINAKKGIDK